MMLKSNQAQMSDKYIVYLSNKYITQIINNNYWIII